MKKEVTFFAVVAGLACAAFAGAATGASGVITVVGNVGPNYTYDIHLTNTGTTNIGTLWYAWVPGEDFLPLTPTATSSPSGWNQDLTLHTGAGDGYSIRWVGGTLASGATLDGFDFTIAATPAQISGNSLYFSGTPVGTTFVYEGAPFTGGSAEFVVNPVPEPAPWMTGGLVALAALAVTRRRKSSLA